jgi:hypothetical protein
MNDTKTLKLVEKLEAYRESLVFNKKDSKNLLQKAGIVNRNGNLTSNYKHLCIPRERV